jgi:hypothetical protein
MEQKSNLYTPQQQITWCLWFALLTQMLVIARTSQTPETLYAMPKNKKEVTKCL